MNKFEQLIEYVINDEDGKARELFHEIVVEKSRTIYEEMMENEEVEEARDEEVDEGKEEIDEADEEEIDEGEEELDEMEMGLGGDKADNLMNSIETEESGVSMEGEDDGAEAEAGDIEDRVVDLEDKLDELMAEFEAMMGDDAGMGDAEMDMDDAEMDMDDAEANAADGMSDEEVVDDEFETEGMFENVTLKAVAKPSNTEEASNKKSVVAANSGARGALAKPVHTGANEGGRHDSSAYKNNVKDMIGKVGNTPAQSTQKPTPATKPNLGQAGGVNNKSVIQ